MMKQFAITAMITVVSFVVHSQHTVTLINSSELKGKVIEMNDSMLILSMNGVEMNFPVDQVANISLVDGVAKEKTTTLSEIEISGSVYYFYNDNYGDKPDTGSDVWILKTDKLSWVAPATGNELTVDTSKLLNSRHVVLCWPPRHEGCERVLARFGISGDADYEAFQSDVSQQIITLEFNERTIKTKVDASGRFTKKVDPGTYLVFVKSNHRDAINIVDINGRWFAKILDLQTESIEVNAVFGLAYYKDNIDW